MKAIVLSWSQWLVESGTDDWTDPIEFGISYVNPKVDMDEFTGSEAGELFRDRKAEKQARKDIHQEYPPEQRTVTPVDILDRDRPRRYLKTQTTVTLKAIKMALSELETAAGDEREGISDRDWETVRCSGGYS